MMIQQCFRPASHRRVYSAGGSAHAFLRELDVLLRQAGIARSTTTLPICASTGDAGEGPPTDLEVRMGRIVRFIDEHLDRPLTLDRLAEEARLSKYHFARTFREEVGAAPWAYVRRARVERARDLLARGVAPAAAAVDAGFFDQSHLTRTMKELVGKTPAQYQREAVQSDRPEAVRSDSREAVRSDRREAVRPDRREAVRSDRKDVQEPGEARPEISPETTK